MNMVSDYIGGHDFDYGDEPKLPVIPHAASFLRPALRRAPAPLIYRRGDIGATMSGIG